MAITRIGSLTEYQAGNNNTGSTSISVPADAEIILIDLKEMKQAEKAEENKRRAEAAHRKVMSE